MMPLSPLYPFRSLAPLFPLDPAWTRKAWGTCVTSDGVWSTKHQLQPREIISGFQPLVWRVLASCFIVHGITTASVSNDGMD